MEKTKPSFVKRLYARLNRDYRVSLIDDETLRQSRQRMIKPITLILWGLLLFLGIVGGTASLIFFTPAIREQIPGYLNPNIDKNLQQLQLRISELEQVREQRDSLLEAFKLMVAFPHMADSRQKSQANNQESAERNEAMATVASYKEPAMAQPTTETRVVYVPPVNRNIPHSSVMLNLFPPVRGRIRKEFDRAKGHYGVDIVAKEKEMVHAATDGSVIFAEYSDKDGYVIGIANDKDIVTFYKHNSRLLKKAGSSAKAGEAIAVIGNTGENSNGPHLHFELWYRGVPMDPLDYYHSFE